MGICNIYLAIPTELKTADSVPYSSFHSSEIQFLIEIRLGEGFPRP
jgi:hypothetical protein